MKKIILSLLGMIVLSTVLSALDEWDCQSKVTRLNYEVELAHELSDTKKLNKLRDILNNVNNIAVKCENIGAREDFDLDGGEWLGTDNLKIQIKKIIKKPSKTITYEKTSNNDDDIIVGETDLEGGVIEIFIKGNTGKCKVNMTYEDEYIGDIVGTDCLQLTNSKGKKILCTAKRKICKTQNEIIDVIKKNNRQINTSQVSHRQVTHKREDISFVGTYNCAMIGKLVLKESGTAKVIFGVEHIGLWVDDGSDGHGGREAIIYVDYGAKDNSDTHTFVRKSNGEYRMNRFFPCEKLR